MSGLHGHQLPATLCSRVYADNTTQDGQTCLEVPAHYSEYDLEELRCQNSRIEKPMLERRMIANWAMRPFLNVLKRNSLGSAGGAGKIDFYPFRFAQARVYFYNQEMTPEAILYYLTDRSNYDVLLCKPLEARTGKQESQYQRVQMKMPKTVESDFQIKCESVFKAAGCTPCRFFTGVVAVVVAAAASVYLTQVF